MVFKYANELEKIETIIKYLAIGKYDVRSRLKIVTQDIIRLSYEQLAEDWIWINEELSRFGPSQRFPDVPEEEIFDDSMHNTLSKIKNSTGQKIAERLWDIYFKLRLLEEEWFEKN